MKKSKFPWHSPPTLSELRRRYKVNRYIRPGARSPLPEDLIIWRRDHEKA